jgi:hypothetical protein
LREFGRGRNAELPESTLKFQGWIYGVLGAAIAGWGTLIAFWALYPFKLVRDGHGMAWHLELVSGTVLIRQFLPYTVLHLTLLLTQ